MDVSQRLGNLIRARHGVIAVRTNEGERVLAALWKMANTKGSPRTTILTWTCSDGVKRLELLKRGKDENAEEYIGRVDIPQFKPKGDQNSMMPFMGGLGDKYAAPPGAIQAVMDYTTEFVKETVVMVVFNYHHWIAEAQVQQLLLDVTENFLQQRRTVVLVGPVFNLPEELQKAVTILDFPLPTPEEIRGELEEIAEAARQAGKFDVDLNGNTQTIVRALQGMTSLEIKHTVNLALATFRRLDASPDVLRLIIDRKKGVVKATRALEFFETDKTMDDIGGLEYLKRYSDEVAVTYTDEAREYGAVPPRGVLLVGPPGTGKSLAAKCIAMRFGVPLLRLDAGSLFSSLVGSSEDNVRQALKVAEAVAPCVLWVDEVEKSMGGGTGGELDGGTSQRVFATLLTWMQERARDAGVFVVMTANSVSRIDPALFQRVDQFCVDFPDWQARKDILAIHLRANGREDWEGLGLDLDYLAGETEGYSGRELEEAVLSAVRKSYLAIVEGKHTGDLTNDFLLEAKEEIVPVSTTMAMELAAIRRWAKMARPAGRPSTYSPSTEKPEEYEAAGVLPD